MVDELMIARNSKSYPYLAIAQHYGVDYGEVLKYADWIKKNWYIMADVPTGWQLEVWKAVENDIASKK